MNSAASGQNSVPWITGGVSSLSLDANSLNGFATPRGTATMCPIRHKRAAHCSLAPANDIVPPPKTRHKGWHAGLASCGV